MERQRVLRVHARNVKCIREVEIDEIGDVHEVRGDAGQGKSAILAAIEAGLRGMDPSLVRNGADSAEIELELTDLKVHRVISAAGGRDNLMVTSQDGPVKHAAAFLAALCGPSAFKPVEWVQLGGGEALGRTERLRKQRDELLAALPIRIDEHRILRAVGDLGQAHIDALAEVNLDDISLEQHALTACAEIHRACYEYRAIQNARAKDAEAALKVYTPPATAPPSKGPEELTAELDTAQKRYYEAEAAGTGTQKLQERALNLRQALETMPVQTSSLDVIREDEARWSAAVESRTATVHDLERQLQEVRDAERKARDELTRVQTLRRREETRQAQQEELAELEASLERSEAPDLAALQKAVDNARGDLELRRQQDKHDEHARAAVEARRRAELYDALVELFRDSLPQALIEESDLPVEGLGVSGDMLTVHGVPLHALGTSEQIKIAVQIAAALNRQIGWVPIDRAESLGRADRVAIGEVQRELGLQVIFVYVDPDAEPAPGTTVMRNGEAMQARAAGE